MSQIDASRLAKALIAWRDAIGPAQVSCDASLLRQASTATFATRSQVAAIIRPRDRAEVQHCVRIANQFRVPIYPISSGKNWGYGSRVPARDAVLLDLGRMKRIVDFSEELAYVTVEPGVTQRQLYEYLQGRGARLWMDATGASPDCSLIGNTLERGFGHTPMGDHCSHVCGFEVVLPTGECIETGFSRFPNSPVGPLSRWGLGPSVDGLFAQSNLGVVTRMSMWLMPAPEYFEAFFFQSDSENGLARAVDALRPLRQDGTLRSVVHIGNDYKVLAGTGQYPWPEAGHRTPLDADTMARLRRTLHIGRWNGSGGLYGTLKQVREARSQLRRALGSKVERLQFVNDRLLRVLPHLATPYSILTGRNITRTLKMLVPVYKLLKGVPTDSSLASAYWRKRTAPAGQMDPDRDGCGLLWCSPVAPITGQHATEVTGLARSVMQDHGFEPIVSVSLLSERSIVSIIAITYDRSVPGDDERALRCHQRLSKDLLERGYPPYRLPLSDAGEHVNRGGAYADLIRAIKAAVDPNDILAPGRYEPAPLHELEPTLVRFA